jgi:hypothetical protein
MSRSSMAFFTCSRISGEALTKNSLTDFGAE